MRLSKTYTAFGLLIFLLMGSLLVAFSPDLPQQHTQAKSQCPYGTKLISENFEGKAVCEISGVLTHDLHLSSDLYWALNGEVHIGVDRVQNVALSIEAGTTVFGKTAKDFLVVNRGSKILAEGTKERPIVFTSKNDAAGLVAKPGEWGGLVIAGEARTNAKGGENSFEFSKKPIYYGGDNDDDSSGVLRYVLVKYAGHIVYTAKELNGISFGGVGRGTEIDYLEVYKGKDDGIELWGGTVNLKHIVLVDNGDDNLDVDEGYRGRIQYLYSSQSVEDAFYARAVEADNNELEHDALPHTEPIISNFEFVGGGYASEAIMLKNGAGIRLLNGKIKEFSQSCLAMESQSTLTNNMVHVQAVELEGCQSLYYGKKLPQESVEEIFTKEHSVGEDFDPTLVINPQSFDPFFEAVDYHGAYKNSNDWRMGWSILY